MLVLSRKEYNGEYTGRASERKWVTRTRLKHIRGCPERAGLSGRIGILLSPHSFETKAMTTILGFASYYLFGHLCQW